MFDWQRRLEDEKERNEQKARERSEKRTAEFARMLEETPIDWEASVDTSPVTLSSYRADAQEELRRILAGSERR